VSARFAFSPGNVFGIIAIKLSIVCAIGCSFS
jgi:hypothetical protein